jgi:hypothetical protein
MNGTVFLHIASVFNNYLTPIAAQRRTRAYVAIFADDYIAGDRGLRMNKG